MAILETERLLLRPPELRDVPALVRWMSDFDIAKNLSTAPHPYTEENARAFVERMADSLKRGDGWCFAIVRKDDYQLIGCCGVHLKDRAYEIGYWLGKPFWNRGYVTEAARRLVAFAFQELKVERVWAGWFYDNPASGRVLEKLGFVPDGAQTRACAARGHEVYCHKVALTRADFRRTTPFTAQRASC
jgi:RimJ/RimL family protein N-acetyltransferase